MDLEETEARNDCAGEGQHQFNRPTELWLRVAVTRNEKLIAEAGDSSGTQKKGNVRCLSRYQATASEDLEDFMCAVVTAIVGVCDSERLV
jgi:hypothetical protein